MNKKKRNFFKAPLLLSGAYEERTITAYNYLV